MQNANINKTCKLSAFAVGVFVLLFNDLSAETIEGSDSLTRPARPVVELLDVLPQPQLPAEVEVGIVQIEQMSQEKVLTTGPLRPQTTTLTGSDPAPKTTQPQYMGFVEGIDKNLRITRVTTDEAFGSQGYSKRQAWNADETLLDIGRKVLDVTSGYSVLFTHPLSGERHWSAINPDLIYGLQRDPTLVNFVVYNVKTKTETLIRKFVDYESCTIGDYEGSLSADDRYAVFACKDVSGNRDLISFDIQEKTVLAKIRAESDFNWASFSQSGKYLVVENNTPGQNANRELVRYDRDFGNPTVLHNLPEHGDLGLDENGDDVYVMIAWDIISYIRLHDGVEIVLGVTDRAGDGHVSCRAYLRPGWCYFSSKNQFQRIGAVRISEFDQVVELWGFSKSTSNRYKVQPKATVSPSGRKIVFTSDWWAQLNQNTPHTGGGGEANTYVLELLPE